MKKLFFIMTMCMALSISCQKEFIEHCNVQKTLDHECAFDKAYSLEIMNQAISTTLSKRGITRSLEQQLEPTHKYVKFMPQNRHQFDFLNDKYALFNFNIDSLTDINGEVLLSTNSKSEFYSYVDYNDVLTDSIPYEIIKTIFDPLSSEEFQSNTSLANDIILEAYSLAGYDQTRSSTPWRPSGTIRVWDDIAQDYVPIEGVTVYVGNSSIINPTPCVTNADGFFESNVTFVDDVRYIVQWKDTPKWSIKFGDIEPAITISSSIRYELSLNIDDDNIGAFNAATIFRAARYYWYEAPQEGLTPPNSQSPIRISCYDEAYDEEYNAIGLFWPYDREDDEPNIEIWCKNKTTHKNMATTFHELGHATHYASIGYSNFNSNDMSDVIIESWANFTKSYLLDRYYEYLEITLDTFFSEGVHQTHSWCDNTSCYIMDKPDDYNCQNWIYNPSSSTIHYTPLFIDILDDFNQYYWYTSVYPNSYNASRVCNDVIRINRADIIEQIAFNSQNVAEVKDLLEDYITEEDLEFSQSDIDDLFEFYMLINN